MIKIIFAAMIFSCFPLTQAFAESADQKSGFYVEPAVTYETETLNVRFPGPANDSNETVAGFGLGARLGMHAYDIAFLALDARYSKPNYSSAALSSSTDSSAYNYGVTLGVQTPLLGIRVWGTYIIDGMLDPGDLRFLGTTVNAKYSGMNGYRVGAGLYVAAISINLEYQDARYNTTTLENIGPFAVGSFNNVSAQQKGYIASISFPIAL